MTKTILFFLVLATLYSLIVSAKKLTKDSFVNNGKEEEVDLTESDIEEADKMEPLTAKKLKKLGIKVPKQPTMGEEVEGDLLNIPRDDGKGRRRKRENREVKLATRKKRSKRDVEMEKFALTVDGVFYFRRIMGFDTKSGKHQTFTYGTWTFGEIAYKLSSRYEPWARHDITKAMLEIEDKTAIGDKKCVKFIPFEKYYPSDTNKIRKIKDEKLKKKLLFNNYLRFYGNDNDHLYIRPDKRCVKKGNCCSSSAGKVKDVGKQRLLLDHSCMGFGTILHELLHALGLFHEQSRSDRDHYVEIIKENIQKGREDQFAKHSFVPPMYKGDHTKDGKIDYANFNSHEFYKKLTPYDFESVMHYPSDAFLKDNAKGKYTIIPKDKKLANNATFMYYLGYNEHLSKYDIEQIRYLYKCYLKDK